MKKTLKLLGKYTDAQFIELGIFLAKQQNMMSPTTMVVEKDSLFRGLKYTVRRIGDEENFLHNKGSKQFSIRRIKQ